MRSPFIAVLALIAVCVGAALGGADPGTAGLDAITKASQDVTLSFPRPGVIGKILVKEGDDVKAGQLLVQMDDSAEQANLAQLKAQAEDQVRIKAAEAELAQKKVDLQKFELAQTKGAATPLEVEHARLDVVIAELTLELAKFQNRQDGLKYEEAKANIERMRLVSGFDGRVEQILVKQGESVNTADNKVIRLVRIDPLWVDVPAPEATVLAFDLPRYRQSPKEAQVEFPQPPGQTQAPRAVGRVIHVAAVADPGSSTLLVRLEVRNESSRHVGEHVKVYFGAATAGLAAQAKSAGSQPADAGK